MRWASEPAHQFSTPKFRPQGVCVHAEQPQDARERPCNYSVN